MKLNEARDLLELGEHFDISDLVSARRRALRRHHPDHGGSREMMERVEAAVGLLAESLSISPSQTVAAEVGLAYDSRRQGRLVHDCPSFTIDVLPVEAFEILLLAAAALDADVAVEDPPYLLEVLLRSPVVAWCRCEVVPEAGGSIITLTSDIGDHDSLEHLRDLWIGSINELQQP